MKQKFIQFCLAQLLSLLGGKNTTQTPETPLCLHVLHYKMQEKY